MVGDKQVPIWHVPYERNPLFTGREAILSGIRESFAAHPIQVLSGMGGVGKTQTALEYAWRHRADYQAIFWLTADSRDLLATEFIGLARPLNLPGQCEQDQSYALAAVKQWFRKNTDWLLVLDNVEDMQLVREFMPADARGHILLTSQRHAERTLHPIEIDKMEPDEAALFLLRRAGIIGLHDTREKANATDFQLASNIAHKMGYLPLALDQAGAYIDAVGYGLNDYLKLYQKLQVQLLQERVEDVTGHPNSVTATLSLAMAKIAQSSAVALDILSLYAFLHPDDIPDEIIVEGAAYPGSVFASQAANPLELNKAFKVLRDYSLVRSNPAIKNITTRSVHRLVQAVHKDKMPAETQCQWAERAVRAVNAVFPDANEFTNWQRCQLYISHAQVCADLIEQWKLAFPEAIRLLDEAGYYLRQIGRYTESEPLLLQAQKILEQSSEPDYLAIAKNLNNIAELYRDQGRYLQAEPLYQQALEMREQWLGAKHPDVATSLNNLGLLYHDEGKYVQAEEVHKRALCIREKVLESEHSDVANSLANIATVYRVQGKYADAEPLLQQTLEIKKKALGSEHPDVATSLNHLASLFQDQGKYQQAEPLFQQALILRKQLLGDTHPDVASSLSNLASLHQAQGKYPQAEPLFQQALTLDKQLLGDTHPNIATNLNNLASLYQAQGKYPQAEPLFQQALMLYKQLLGDTHPDVATSLSNLASLYQAQGKYLQAEPLFQQALMLYKQLLGDTHPYVATNLSNLASLFQDQGKYQQAEPLFQQALALRNQLLGDAHPDVATSLSKLASLFQDQGKYIYAKSYYQKALSIREKTLGPKHPNVANSLNNLATFYSKQHDYKQAEPLYQRALSIREQALGLYHPKTLNCMVSYRNMLLKAKRNKKVAELTIRIEAIQAMLAHDSESDDSSQ